MRKVIFLVAVFATCASCYGQGFGYKFGGSSYMYQRYSSKPSYRYSYKSFYSTSVPIQTRNYNVPRGRWETNYGGGYRRTYDY